MTAYNIRPGKARNAFARSTAARPALIIHRMINGDANITADGPHAAAARYAAVAVDQAIDRELTYHIPPALAGQVSVGSRVEVPLGRGNKVASGTVVALLQEVAPAAAPAAKSKPLVTPSTAPDAAGDDSLFGNLGDEPLMPLPAEPAAERFKPIAGVLTEVLPVPADLIELARWISHYYCCPLGLVLSGIVPAAVKKNIRLPSRMLVGLSPLATTESLAQVRTGKKYRDAFAQACNLLAQGELEEMRLAQSSGLSRLVIRRLAAKGVLVRRKEVAWPEPPGNASPIVGDAGALPLTDEQAAAMAALEPLLTGPKFAVQVLHGVTGSGKTEVYIRAIEKVVAAGRRAIVLVPEIALTPQTVGRFTRRFARVAVLHSKLKGSQRHQQWHAVAGGWAQVVVGVRSAVFAPAADIGLIVVDEEHEHSYKQDSAPRYHGRDVAIRRAQQLNVPVILGSATPSLETWHNAHHNPHYHLTALSTRPLGLQMPKVITVDMKMERLKRRGLHVLSTVLEAHINRVVEARKQVILMLNRRGYAHYVACARCPWILMCPHCDATMVVHQVGDAPIDSPRQRSVVQCHYCLTSQVLPTACPDCRSGIVQLGQGTQRAEAELLRKFPKLRLARMDSDAMRSAKDYQDVLDRFGSGQLDMLIGTQMIAKGLDFPNVELVGVLNADLAMTSPDFRAAERTFALICQVAGRSGRAGKQGLVVVQTMQPQEPAIVHACRHDYSGFVADELPHRQRFDYPPFGRLIRLVVSHKNDAKAKELAAELAAMVENAASGVDAVVRLLGPQAAPMARLNEVFRQELLLMCPMAAPLQKLLQRLRQQGLFRQFAGNLVVDVDPVSMM